MTFPFACASETPKMAITFFMSEDVSLPRDKPFLPLNEVKSPINVVLPD